jgi:hypothetical protein
MKNWIIRMPEPIPLGLTFLLAIALAIVSASFVNIRLGGLVETVFTLRTHFFFVIWPSQESRSRATWRLGRDWHSLECFADAADDALITIDHNNDDRQNENIRNSAKLSRLGFGGQNGQNAISHSRNMSV